MGKCIIILCFFISQIAAAQTPKQQTKNNPHATLKKTFSIDEPTAFTCDELINYRDKTLAKQFESAYNKYTLSLEAKKDLDDIKKHLLDDKASWYQLLSTNAASSDFTLAFAELANVWKLLCDKYLTILKLISGNSLENTGMEYGTKNQEYWYNLLSAGKSLQKAVTDNADKEALKMAVSKSKDKEVKKLNDAVHAAIDFSSNLEKFTKLEKDHTELKSEVKRLLDMIDIRYSEYEESISSLRENQNTINEVVKAIDKYLLEKKCNPTDAIEETLQKELTKNNSSAINATKQIKLDTNYMYFSASFIVPGDDFYPSGARTQKRLIFISNPISYSGDFEEVKQKLTETFESKLKQEMSDFKSNNSYQLYCNTHNGSLSNDLLKSFSECEVAIQKQKKSISDGWRGDSKRFKIIQLQ
ncbi:MAG: hypothetical protein KF746_02125 [Chitinophagaceae bacterium]|nr:hypothetical protein [Chitinophagaceae bacterium]